MIERMEQYGYEFVDLHQKEKGEFVEYICPNNITHMNARQYFNKRNFRTDITCQSCLTNKSSYGETMLCEYVKSLIGENNVIQNDRSVISPKEIDVFIPSHNLGIEFNGLYYHAFENGKDESYHYMKYKNCLDRGVELMQFFEDEWLYKENICKSMIKNKLGLNDLKIYARQCSIEELKPTTAKEFVDNNHLYGYKKCSMKLGLYYGDELVQVMTFSKNNHSRKQKGWEVDRFCSLLYTNVIGGANRLFQYFIRNYNPEEVISYADLRFGAGKIYENLGFKFNKNTVAGYCYFIPMVCIERIHRYNLRKTESERDSDKTEFELRNEQGYYRIYDAGHAKWLWTKTFE